MKNYNRRTVYAKAVNHATHVVYHSLRLAKKLVGGHHLYSAKGTRYNNRTWVDYNPVLK